MNASQTEPTTLVSPVTPDSAADHHEPSRQQAARFALEFSDGNLTGLRKYLARTREARDWQDRILMLDFVAPAIPLDVLETACAIEPDAADLAIVRCAYYSLQTMEHRFGDFDEASALSVRKAADSIRAAMTSLEAAAELDPADPTAFACIMRALGIFDKLKPVMQHAFQQAVAIAPELAGFLATRQLAPASSNLPN